MKKTVFRFRVLHGSHFQAGRKFAAGQIIESEKDLAKTFKGKFVLLSQEETKEQITTPPGAEPTGESTMEWGEDVTPDFPIAEAAKLKVYRDADGFFHVVDPLKDPNAEIVKPHNKAAEITKAIKRL